MNNIFEAIEIEQWPDNANDFYEMLGKKIAEIPEEYRKVARIAFIAEEGPCDQVELSWLRPETQADIDKRNNKEKTLKEYQKQRELEQLARLKAKYEAD